MKKPKLPLATNGGTAEHSDGFRDVILQRGSYRVCHATDRIQWVLQHRRSGQHGGKEKWDNLGYCRARSTLARLCRAHMGEVPDEIADMPEFYTVEKGNV